MDRRSVPKVKVMGSSMRVPACDRGSRERMKRSGKKGASRAEARV